MVAVKPEIRACQTRHFCFKNERVTFIIAIGHSQSESSVNVHMNYPRNVRHEISFYDVLKKT